MVRGAIAAIAVMLLGSTAAIADDFVPPVVGGRTYVQHQIFAAKARHPEIAQIEVVGSREDGKGSIVLGSTRDAAKVMTPVANPDMALGAHQVNGTLEVREPFNSNTHHRIGTITITFRAGGSAAVLTKIAEKVASDMAHVTLSAKNAADPYPFDPHYGPTTYAQKLTDRTIASHPDLLVMMIHATPTGANAEKNVIIGSNIGRLGKLADDDDLRVIRNGETNLEVGGDKDRFETELPLNDAKGQRIGALGLVFNYHDGENKETIHAHGLAIRDEIARSIPTSAALFAAAH